MNNNIPGELATTAASSPDEGDSSGVLDSPLDPAAVKLTQLKGVSTLHVKAVLKRLEFTPGAEFVCKTLKRLGAKLAILTTTPIQEVADYIAKELGFDYVFCRRAAEPPEKS